MKIFSTYSVKIQAPFNKIFEGTAKQYRNAVNFFIRVRLLEDSLFRNVGTQKDQVNMMETLTVPNNQRQGYQRRHRCKNGAIHRRYGGVVQRFHQEAIAFASSKAGRSTTVT